MKRFYKTVEIGEEGGYWHINLDGKPVKTPAGVVLHIPLEKLAILSAQEWDRQEGNIKPESMPVNQIVITTLDRVMPEREAISAHVLSYLDTDLLLYRADDGNPLAIKQQTAWDPWVQWFEQISGVRLATTTTLQALKQPPDAHAFLMSEMTKMDIWTFSILQIVTSLSGSVILALAFVKGFANGDDVFFASHVEENHRAGIYNEDLHGRAPHEQKSQDAMRRDLAAARTVLDSI